MRFILNFFCVSRDETQKNCKWNAKKFVKRKKIAKWNGKKWTGGSQENQLFEDISWRKRSWNLVFSQLNVENQGAFFKKHLFFCFGIPLIPQFLSNHYFSYHWNMYIKKFRAITKFHTISLLIKHSHYGVPKFNKKLNLT